MRGPFLLLFILFASMLCADEFIENYHVDILLRQDGSLKVIEEIRYHFGDRMRHGIFRDIPATAQTQGGVVANRDIGLGYFRVTGDGGPVSYDRETVYGDSGRNVRLKIGNPDRWVTGTHIYRITYRVAHGITTQGHDDALRWNAVGSGWKIPIHAATVVVHFPQTLSEANVHQNVYTGRYGVKDSHAELNWSDGNTLKARVTLLQPHEGLTIEAAFPKDTLEQNGEPGFFERLQLWIRMFWGWIAAAGVWIVMHWYWYQKGRDVPKRSVAVRYEAPEGLDIMQSGLIFDQFADHDDLSPAIVELAEKGYVKIVKTDEKVTLNKTDKDIAGLSASQRELITLLFHRNDNFEFPIPTVKDANRLLVGLNRIGDQLYQWSYEEKFMQKNPKSARYGFLAISGLLIITFGVFAYYGSRAMAGLDSQMITVCTIFGIFGILNFISPGLLSKIKGVLFFAGIYAVYYFSFGLRAGTGQDVLDWTILLYTPLFPIVLVTVPAYIYYKNMGAYTKKGAETYAWLLGYREFIKRVEIDEVKRRLDVDPGFLDKTLPYAMLFGLVGRWIDLYAAAQVESTKWYDGDFSDFTSFHDSIDLMGPFEGSSSTGAGGFSGGGSFSGGGFGGGGGGSW